MQTRGDGRDDLGLGLDEWSSLPRTSVPKDLGSHRRRTATGILPSPGPGFPGEERLAKPDLGTCIRPGVSTSLAACHLTPFTIPCDGIHGWDGDDHVCSTGVRLVSDHCHCHCPVPSCPYP
jgi:hypothetical protein